MDKKKEIRLFLAKTIFYFVIILILLYLYSYSHTGGAHFIYNEFQRDLLEKLIMKLLEQIFEIANKNTDLLVLAQREQKFTYRQLFVAVSEISKKIKERTLVNRPILIFGKNDFISLAAMLAANLTGHAYIPVDAHTPFERT